MLSFTCNTNVSNVTLYIELGDILIVYTRSTVSICEKGSSGQIAANKISDIKVIFL